MHEELIERLKVVLSELRLDYGDKQADAVLEAITALSTPTSPEVDELCGELENEIRELYPHKSAIEMKRAITTISALSQRNAVLETEVRKWEWKPMDTAPKDTEILVVFTGMKTPIMELAISAQHDDSWDTPCGIYQKHEALCWRKLPPLPTQKASELPEATNG